MKDIPLTALKRRPLPLDMNNPAIRLITKSLPQSKWTQAVSPFPRTFCRIDKRAGTASFYLPGEVVEFKDGTKYVVRHDLSIRRIDEVVE